MNARRVPAGLAAIERSKIYPLPIFQREAGFDDKALRNARRAGLVIRRCSKRSYIAGDDFHAFLTQSCPVVGPRGELIETVAPQA